MIRKLRVLTLALAAVLATSAVAASGAQAASSLDVGETPSVITGAIVNAAAPHVWTFGKDTVKCEVANLEGTFTGANVTEGTLTGTYAKCKINGTAAEVRMNGCKYTLTNTPAAFVFNVDIAQCTTGKLIELKSLVVNCTITVKEQGPVAKATMENVAGSNPNHVVANVAIAGLHSVADGTECLEPNGTTLAAGTLTGKTTVKAFEDLGLGAEKEEFGHKFKPFLDGAQTSLVST